jgi:prophage regulatory protein
MVTKTDPGRGEQAAAASIRLIPLQEVEARTSKSRWWINRQIAAGEFPKPVRLGYRRTVFVEAEINAWLAALVAARDSGRAS